MLAEFVLGLERFAVFELARLGPVPGHLGGVHPGKFRYMAALAGHLVRVVIGFGLGFVWGAAVARFAGDLGGQVVFDQALSMGICRHRVNPAGNIVLTGGVTAHAVKILAVRAHVNIQGLVGLGQRGVQITVFDAVTTAAEKMTGSAILAGGSTHTLCHLVPIRGMVRFTVAFEDLGFGHGVAGAGWKLFVGPGLFVADQAIDVRHVIEIEGIVGVAITRVTLRAAPLVGWDGDTEVVDQVVLTVWPFFETGDVRRHTLPGEMRAHEHVGADQAVAVEAVARAGVFVLGEIAVVQLLGLVGAAGNRVAVQGVENAVAVQVFFRISNAVAVEIPAGQSVCAVNAIDAVNARAGDQGSIDRLFAGASDLLPLWIAEPYVDLAPPITGALELRAAAGLAGARAEPMDAFAAHSLQAALELLDGDRR